MRYFCYGLTIESILALPELLPTDAHESVPDVIIQYGKTSFIPPKFEGFECAARGTDDEGYLYWNGVGTFRVREGREITIDAMVGVEAETLRLCLLGFVFSLLLHQRGLFVLHASGVEVNGGAVLFVGNSGYGKSTLAASLRSRGYCHVTDDQGILRVTADSSPMVLPSFPRIKLWPDSVASLGTNPADLPRLVAETDKRSLSTVSTFRHDPLPLRRIYFLDNADTPEIIPLKAQQAMLGLIANSGISFFQKLISPAVAKLHFEQCSRILTNIPAYTLKRTRSLDRLPEFIDLVERHLAS